MRRIHQPDDGVVDRSSEADALDEVGRSFVKPVEQRNLGRGGGMVTKKHPEVPLHLPHRIATDTDTLWREGLARYQRRNQRTLPAGVKAPAVIAALDLPPIETASAERHPTMRTRVAQCERHAGRVAADQDRLTQHDFRQHRPALQATARDCVIPGLAQRRGSVLG